IHYGGGQPPGGHARVGQQILDQLLHAGGAIHGVVDEVVRILVELVVVAVGQQLGVTGHHAKRFLQVVRGDVGESFEFAVAARHNFAQQPGGAGQALLGQLYDEGGPRLVVGGVSFQ